MPGGQIQDPRAPRKIFGLSITEQVEWGVAYAVRGVLVSKPERGVLPDTPTGNLPHEPGVPIDIEDLIRTRLIELRDTRPGLFADVAGIGVSTVGIVNRKRLLLEKIPRKNWKKPNRNHVIDFKNLFLNRLDDGKLLFPKIGRRDRIVVNNDASARCLAEYIYGLENPDDVSSLLYFAIGEGMNGAFAYQGDLLQMERHSEMGHCLPQLHPMDARFRVEHTGCPSHITCFEGVASTARIRRQWGFEISELPEDHPAWEIETNYLTQFITIGVLTLNPKQVLLGGGIFTGKKGKHLIDQIRSEFWRRNAHHFPDFNDKKRVDSFIRRARFGNGVKVLSALTLGCLGAFSEDRQKTIEEKRGERILGVTNLSEYRREKAKAT